MSLKHRQITVAVLVLALGLAGCTTPQHKSALGGRQQAADLSSKAVPQPAAVGSVRSDTPSFVETPNAFITRARIGQSQRVREEKTLPQFFDEPLAMLMGPAQVTLAKVIKELELEMRVPVRVLPDVYELTEQTARRSDAPATAPGPIPAGGAIPPAAAMPAMGALPGAGGNASAPREAAIPPFELNVTGTRKEVLDVIAAKAGIEWDYVDRQVVLSRLLSKTFTLDSSARSMKSSDSLSAVGGASGAGGSSSTASTASNEFSMKSSIDPLRDLEDQLSAVKSSRGRVVVSRSNNTVLVRDVRAVVDEAASIIDRFNTLMSRQIVIDFEVISFTANSNDSLGFDLSLVLQNMIGSTKSSLFRLTAPPSMADSAAGVVSWTAQQGRTSTAAGSSILVNALSQIGATRVVHKGVKPTRNNVPAEFQNLRDRSYLAETTSAASESSTTSGLKQSVVTTGFLSKVYPTVLSGNRIALDGVLSISNLDRLVTATSGDSSVQSPDVSRMNAPFHNIVRSGEYVAFQAFERDVDTGDRTSMDPVGVLGFNAKGNGSTERFIVVMKATILGGQ